MKIFFSVGEPSGDLHGANLIRELRRQRPDLEFVGYGGPKMAAAGCQLHEDLTQLAVMWMLRVVLNIHKFSALLKKADRFFQEHRPDAVVLIDYPGFNWWVARRAKAHGIPVFYYGAPQMWAWAGWRVKKMRRLVDHVLCKLPFEAEWYQQRGCNATYIGHPYYDELENQRPDAAFLKRLESRDPLVAILPGSRTQEVVKNLPWFIKAAGVIREAVPNASFAIASFNEKQARIARAMAREAEFPLDVYVSRTAEIIQASRCCLACSGSVSLELLYHEKPTVVLYYINRWVYHFVRAFLVKVKFITLVNLLDCDNPFEHCPQPFDPHAPGAERVPFPEYPTYEDKSSQLAEHVIQWLGDAELYERKCGQLKRLKRKLAHGGASRAAASFILAALTDSAPALWAERRSA